jgi:predicted enzyme related to lactoylglutathione lyase
MPETTTQAPPQAGTFCWNELMTRDIEAASDFYSALFGWKAEQMDMGEHGTYTLWRCGDKHAGGMMKSDAEEAPTCWLSYIAVDDVDASTKKAEGLGAKVCVQPEDIPNIGRFSVITDPTGAALGLFQGTG